MRILFVYSLQDYRTPNKPLNKQGQIQFGISYISSLLKAKGHITDLLVLTRKTKKRFIYKFINNFNPDLIGFTAIATEYYFIAKIAKLIKSLFPSIYLLIGGVHISLNPEKGIKDVFDAICIGEGEYPTLELVKQLENGKKPTKISNLWIKNDQQIEKNATRDFIRDMDNLPFHDRQMWQKWIRYPNTRHTILLGRGCPFNCTYCSNHALKKLSSGKYVRFRSVKSIIDELRNLINTYQNVKDVYFEVETIGANLEYGITLCSELEKFNNKLPKKISFGINLRIIPKRNFEPLFLAMKKANFKFINIGIESGSKRIRKEILKRDYSNNDIIKNIRIAKLYGLNISTYNLIGLPEETLEDIKKTIDINRRCMPNNLQVSIFFPYPGTDLYRICKKKELLINQTDSQIERSRVSLNLEYLSKKQVRKQYIWFNFNVYRGYRSLPLLLFKLIITKLNYNLYINRLLRLITTFKFITLWFKTGI